jgi:hypothetical protein
VDGEVLHLISLRGEMELEFVENAKMQDKLCIILLKKKSTSEKLSKTQFFIYLITLSLVSLDVANP